MKTAKESRNFYNKCHQYEIIQEYNRWQIPELLVKYLLPFLSGDEQILDVGCGPGLIGNKLEEKGWKGTLIGIDIAEERLEEAVSKPSYNFCIHADAYHLPFVKQTFDIVVSSAMVGLTEIKSIQEMYRLVKPNGYFACIVGEFNQDWCRKRFKKAIQYFNHLSQSPNIQKVFYKDLGTGYVSEYNDEHYIYYIFRRILGGNNGSELS